MFSPGSDCLESCNCFVTTSLYRNWVEPRNLNNIKTVWSVGWTSGRLVIYMNFYMSEDRIIPHRLVSARKPLSQNTEQWLTWTFMQFMFEGKIHQLLYDSSKGGSLSLDMVTNTNSPSSDSVSDVLKRKYPSSRPPVCPESVIQGQPPNSHLNNCLWFIGCYFDSVCRSSYQQCSLTIISRCPCL